MKAKLFSLMLGLVAFGHAAHAQNTGYKMNVKMTDGSFFSVPADDVSEVYFTTTEEKQFTDTYYTVSGRAEKGPFKSGANVTMQPLDPLLNALGSPQSTLTFNDCGNYSFRNSLFKYPYVQVTAKGLFYNEYNDLKTRDAQLTLYSYADIQGNSTVNANIVTHLISERFVNLVLGGMDFDAALHKSQGELLAAFGLQRLNDKDFTKVSITDGDDYAAALLAIGIPMLLWRDGAELTTFINQLRYDFADDGKLTEPNKQQFNHDRNVTSQRELIEKLIAKYKEYGMDVSVKDLKYFYDWDDDGVAGNEIYDPSQPATYDVTSISAPMNGGTYTVNVSCNVPLYTSPLNYGDISYPSNQGFVQSDMNLTTTYNNGVLSITVNPAQYRIISDRTVFLYDAIGNIAVTVAVSQEGNPSGTFLTELGKNYVMGICQNLSSAHARYRIADAKYTGITENNDFHAPLDVYNSNLNYLFSYPYQLISRNMEAFRNTSSPSVYALLPMAVLTNTLAYYELVTMFGGVPYINQEQDMYNYSIPRTAQDEILNKLVEDLTSIMDKLQDNKGGYIASEDDIAMPSKDLACVVLADIYMYQGNYSAAMSLLEEIVNGSRYTLSATQNGLAQNDAEIIWSMPTTNSGGGITRAASIDYDANYTIIKTYSDVLLSLAECESKLGNDTKANEYLNQVKSAKGIETTSTDVIPAISEVRSKIQIDFGGYFAFLKRTGLAQSTLGLEEYQLLFPIPQDEIYRNPAMTQNPRYGGSVTR